MSEPVVCELCGGLMETHASYVVKVEVYADPTIPEIDAESLGDEGAAAMEQVIEELQKYTTDELQDQVHRRFEFRICRGCQRGFIANPLGKPRGKGREGRN